MNKGEMFRIFRSFKKMKVHCLYDSETLMATGADPGFSNGGGGAVHTL